VRLEALLVTVPSSHNRIDYRRRLQPRLAAPGAARRPNVTLESRCIEPVRQLALGDLASKTERALRSLTARRRLKFSGASADSKERCIRFRTCERSPRFLTKPRRK
jgi:hypothetical protein